MSTRIKIIKGIKESNSVKKEEILTSISISRFWGGSKKGRMLQIKVCNSDGYIQLTEAESVEMARTLLNSFDYTIYPSE